MLATETIFTSRLSDKTYYGHLGGGGEEGSIKLLFQCHSFFLILTARVKTLSDIACQVYRSKSMSHTGFRSSGIFLEGWDDTPDGYP